MKKDAAEVRRLKQRLELAHKRIDVLLAENEQLQAAMLELREGQVAAARRRSWGNR